VIRGSSVGTMNSFGNKRPRNRASILEMGKTSSTTCVSYDEGTVRLKHSLSSSAEAEFLQLYLHSSAFLKGVVLSSAEG